MILLRVCSNCGSEVSLDYKFCKKCGTKVITEEGNTSGSPQQLPDNVPGTEPNSSNIVPSLTPNQDKEPSNEQVQVIPMAEAKPGPAFRTGKFRTRLILVASLLLVVVLLVGGYRLGEYWTSNERLISRFHQAIESQDYKAVASMFVSDGESVVINEQSVKSYVDYLKENEDQVSEIVKDLRKQAFTLQDGDEIEPDASHEVLLEQNGKVALLFKKYQLSIMPVHIRVATNYKDTVVKINGEKVAVSSEEEFAQTFGPYFPGVFELETNLHTDWIDLERKETASVMSGWQDYEAYMELDGTEVEIDTGYYDETGLKGELIVNSTPTGINPFETRMFGPVPTDGTVKLAIDMNLPWGGMRTVEVPVEGSLVQINIGDIQDTAFEDKLIDQIVEFNRKEVKAVASGDLSTLTLVTDNLIHYEQMKVEQAKQNPTTQRTTYLGSTFDLDRIIISQVAGQWTASLLTTGTYKYEYKQDADWGEGFEETAFRYFEMIYDENKKQWLVDGVAVFYDGEELSSNLKEVKEQAAVAHEAAVQTTADSMDLAGLQSFMNNYLTLSVQAINSRDFNLVSGLLDSEGPAYKQSMDYIPYLEKKGIREELLNVQVVSSRPLDDTSIEVTTNDAYNIINSDGSSKERTYTSIYKLVAHNGEWQVHTLLETKEQ